MKKNMGRTDRAIRALVVGGAVAGSAVLGFATAGGIALLVVAAIMAVTASGGNCPAYGLLGIRTTCSRDAGVGCRRQQHLHRAA